MTDPVPEWRDEGAVSRGQKVPPPSATGCLVVMLLSVAIVIAAAVLGIQTRVGADLVANALRRQTGIDLAVGSASLAWPLDIVLCDVQTKPTTTPLGGLKAREIRLGLRWGGSLEVALRGIRLDLVQIASGWVPAPFEKIGSLADVRDTVALLGEGPRVAALDIRDSAIVWSGPDGERLASVDGLGVSMRPVDLGERRLRVMEVTARNVFRYGGVKGLGMRRLWLSTTDNPYLEVEYRGTWEGLDSSLKDWWSAPTNTGKRGM